MLRMSRTNMTTAAAVAAAALGGATIADAATSSSPTGAQERAGGAGETALTGTTAARVKAAALARVEGTVLRVETDRDGIYEAHVRRADGTEVEVAVNRQFEVTAVEEHGACGPGGHGGPGGRGHADLAAVATQLGVSESKLEAAVEAARPDRGTPGDRRDRAAALAGALGVETSAVQEVLDDFRPGDGGRREGGTRPDRSELVAALAKGLSIDTAKVEAALEKAQAAHRAAHEAERTSLYSAIAKAVDKTPAQVRAAFEAVRPPRTAP